MWIYRDISHQVKKLPKNFVGMLTGPRQCGKSALLLHTLGENIRLIECDDLDQRLRLNSDPALFLNDLDRPVIIDEAQYCPNLFPELKLRIDRARRNGKTLPPIWITGSHQTLLSTGPRESLAGRSYRLEMNTLSISELSKLAHFSLSDYFWKGGWPELYKESGLNVVSYLDEYVRTFVEKDIALASGVTKLGEFIHALKLLSLRVGQYLNLSEIGSQVGAKGETIQTWIHLLERNGLITLLPPYFNNANKRLIKSPKLYFNDVGLAVRLQGWRSSEPMLLSPQIGHLFENAVFAELLRIKQNEQLELDIFGYRTRDKEEVDFVIKGQHTKHGELWLIIEVKYSIQGSLNVTWPKSLESDLAKQRPSRLIINAGKERFKTRDAEVIPVIQLRDYILDWIQQS